MSVSSPKSIPNLLAMPRSISLVVLSVGALAFLIFIGSQLYVTNAVGSTLHSYILGVDRSRNPVVVPMVNNKTTVFVTSKESTNGVQKDLGLSEEDNRDDKQNTLDSVIKTFSEAPAAASVNNTVAENNATLVDSDGKIPVSDGADNHRDDGSASSNETLSEASQSPSETTVIQKVDSTSCNLYSGKWFHDPIGPVYTNNTCPMITQMQNCQGNGRPDKDYENWRWKPDQCNLPRFDGRKFLELMQGKTLAYIGDSVARNQMESMLCMLWQVEVPKNRGSRRMQKWWFRSTNTNVVRIWSSWLVHTSNEAIDFAPEGVVKVHLDLPDENFMEFLPRFDVVVLSSGHWFAKQSAYVLNGKVVGGQLWWPKNAGHMQMNNIEAFGVSVETALTAIAGHPNFSGLAIVRSYSPDHYEGGAWNTGGSCTGKVKPATEIVRNRFTDVMHDKQVTGFQKAIERAKGPAKLRLMDITDVYGYRHDGHPGPYRSPDPNKQTKRGPNGQPPPQDCLHWCMPGPIDTWNEILLEIIRRDFERS